MTYMLIGIILFFGVHLLPALSLRETVIGKIGANPYKAIFSILSFVGLVLMVIGYQNLPATPVWAAYQNGLGLMMLLMPIAFILFGASHMNGYIKRWMRHPMLWGLLLWSGGHLIVNGDTASAFLFGSFFIYAVVDLIITKPAKFKDQPPSWKFDIIAIVSGLIIFAVIMWLHEYIAGVALIG